MKLFLIIIGFSFISVFGISQTASITIKVSNIENVKGEMIIAIFNSAAGFPDGDTYFIGKKVAVKSKEFKYVINDIPFGTYAIAIYQDLDKNGEFDKNWIGIPSEPYGFTYKNVGETGSVDFNEATFELKGDKVVSIKLID